MLEPLWASAATLASPVLRLYLRYRATRGKELPNRLGERRGLDPTPRPRGRLVWLHAASVGEAMSVLPVLAALVRRAPEAGVLLTTGTVTSARLMDRRLPELGLSEHVSHRFVPLDVPAWAARFLDHWRPDVAGFVESELWPNILAACHARGIPVMLVNARMSARSAAAWARVPSAARRIVGGFARVHARGEEDAARLRLLGAQGVEVAGDLKLAAPPLPVDPVACAELTARLAGRPVWTAGSTHPGEEPLIRAVHDALRPAFPGLLTIVAPRHPERGPALAASLGAPRRGLGQSPPDEGLWLADTLGEMGLWYRLARVAFVGRSLLPPGGGQNPLEPARLGRPIVSGPHTGNFTEHVILLRAAGALEVAADVPALTRFVGAMLADPEAATRMGERGKTAVRVPETLPDNTAQALLELMRGA